MRNYIQKNISLIEADQKKWDSIKNKYRPIDIWRLGIDTAIINKEAKMLDKQ